MLLLGQLKNIVLGTGDQSLGLAVLAKLATAQIQWNTVKQLGIRKVLLENVDWDVQGSILQLIHNLLNKVAIVLGGCHLTAGEQAHRCFDVPLGVFDISWDLERVALLDKLLRELLNQKPRRHRNAHHSRTVG